MALLATMLGACASLPPPTAGRAPDTALAARADAPLVALASRALQRVSSDGPTGVLGLTFPSVALEARLQLIRRARSSVDLQTFHLADDSVGHAVLRELRDAARRGVRVRLLLDDFHTTGLDELLIGLAAHEHVAVRVFNPFTAARGSSVGRWLQFAGDFQRLNHRMHNKLFIVDGAMALVGGRNLADGYFQRDAGANFIDFDVLTVGAVLPELSAVFDRYWNSAQAHDLTTLVPAGDRAAQQAHFDSATGPRAPAFSPPQVWRGQPVPHFADLLDSGLSGLLGAEVVAHADTPAKLERTPGDWSATTTAFALQTFRQARGELMLYSPYFIPGTSGMAGLREARSHGITVRVITNSLGATDEPQASMAYERYRMQLLQMGVELYEVSALQTLRDEAARHAFGHSRAQLHAKLALVDRRTVLLGSMNLDQRSATTNTELTLRVHSPELAAQILAWFNSRERNDVRGAYQVRLRPDGQGLQWVALLGEGRSEVLDEDPEFQPWERLRLWFLSLFVPESLL